ncbi:hypothetical protein [Thermoanaerobacterium butyriciformans]|uniref:Uncharacterized protein n=1 Tax=Thermoanaerobacterium butyriciformans TaxID=1702242 RepID=A0ABS4NAS5_9THEO|nr:hypothetical protein [Thermoanaerobacterium butyriciformans]MBP2070767.1 hypothetical protein [Thermoanaerobacterium butyriciformans]
MQKFEISCMRKKHTIFVNDKGQLIFLNHTKEELEAEIALMQLGTDKISKCAKVLYQLRNPKKETKINFAKEEIPLKEFLSKRLQIHEKRKTKNYKSINLKIHLAKKIYKKINETIKFLILKQSTYRFANNRWVDSENIVTVVNDKTPNIEQRSWRVWSRNGKWSGNSTEITVSVPFIRWYKNVYQKGLALVDGIFILDILEETPDHYIVLAGKKGRGFTITPCKAKINKTNKNLKWLKQV